MLFLKAEVALETKLYLSFTSKMHIFTLESPPTLLKDNTKSHSGINSWLCLWHSKFYFVFAVYISQFFFLSVCSIAWRLQRDLYNFSWQHLLLILSSVWHHWIVFAMQNFLSLNFFPTDPSTLLDSYSIIETRTHRNGRGKQAKTKNKRHDKTQRNISNFAGRSHSKKKEWEKSRWLSSEAIKSLGTVKIEMRKN